MRLAILLATTVVVSLTCQISVTAQVSSTGLVCVRGDDGGVLYCHGTKSFSAPGTSDEAGTATSGSDNTQELRTYYHAIPEDAEPPFDTGFCITNSGAEVHCYVQFDPQGPVEGVSPAGYALSYWQGIPLPPPDPYIAPGRAITGMYAYLETRGTTSHTYTEPDTPFGPLTITAKGRYYVDWGDGTRTGPHTAEGEPWPDGDIKHEYVNVGFYDVVVTERWTATWTSSEGSGTLGELRTVGRIDDFPVQQIQAVVFQ